MMEKPSERLETLGLTLPPVPKPVAAYVPAVRDGNHLLLSGQLPMRDGKLAYAGQAGLDRTLEEATQAARLCALNATAVAAEAAGGIDNIDRVLKVVVYVASHEGFVNPHKAANGASELLQDIFGEKGQHARAAVGVAYLPLDATVEVDVTFTAKS
jgi:enamine deaminase RidA (YjgF/YER057c/UK114 family)